MTKKGKDNQRISKLENQEIWRLANLWEKFSGSVVTENQKKPPPSPLEEGECSDGKGECGDRKSKGMMEKCNGNHYWVGYL